MNRWNKKGLEHGYWHAKWSNGKSWCKCTSNNGILLGYLEAYHENGKIHYKRICI